jgi:hypothetical protein
MHEQLTWPQSYFVAFCFILTIALLFTIVFTGCYIWENRDKFWAKIILLIVSFFSALTLMAIMFHNQN